MESLDSPVVRAQNEFRQSQQYEAPPLSRSLMNYESSVVSPKDVGREITTWTRRGWEYYELVPFQDGGQAFFLILFMERPPEAEAPDAAA